MKNLFRCFLVFMIFIFSACKSHVEDGVNGTSVIIKSPLVSNILYNSAQVQINIQGGVLKEKGVCYSTTPNPNILNNMIKAIEDSNQFTISLEGLSVSTIYYVRGYAIDEENNLFYSDIVQFSTRQRDVIDELEHYEAPIYNDNYMAINNWDYHDKWNLANVHDPSVFKAEDGYYYMYQTDASYGDEHKKDGGHFHCRRSKNLVDWEYLGGTMREVPAWIKEKLNLYRKELGLYTIESPNYGFWAPVARKVRDGLYRIYYAITIFDPINNEEPNSCSERAFIGLMETSNPASNRWEDKGYVITSSSNRGKNWIWENNQWEETYFKWNAIDPSYLITAEGKHWLIYGSWHSGIVAVELNPVTGKVLNDLPNPWGDDEDIEPYGVKIATRNGYSRWQGSEAPEIVYRDNYYYLFLAYDAVDIPYNTRVVRSSNILGPYYGIDGTNVTAPGGEAFPIVTHPYRFNNSYGWVGFSHCCVFEDGNDHWFYASQARFPNNVPGIWASNVVMVGHVRRIIWTEDGWPLVLPERYGNVPNIPVKEYELEGEWEHIELKYEYGIQQSSILMRLDANHEITAGKWKGKRWKYDETNQILIIDNGIKLYVSREVDWEREPRVHTIVFAGYDGVITHWGKLKK